MATLSSITELVALFVWLVTARPMVTFVVIGITAGTPFVVQFSPSVENEAVKLLPFRES